MADEQVTQGLEKVADAAQQVANATTGAKGKTRTLDFLMEVTLNLTVEVGRARMTIQDILQLGQGSVVELTKLAGEPLDIYVNNRQVARGEAVIVNEKFGVRLTDIISPEDRVGAIGE